MKIISPNNSFNFGANPLGPEHLKDIKRIINCGLDGIETKLIEDVKAGAPSLIKKLGDVEYIPPDSLRRRFFNGLKDLGEIPFDIIDSIAGKFPNSKLNKANFLLKHRESALLEDKVKALQGMYENAQNFTKDSLGKGQKLPQKCNEFCHSICDPVADEFNKLLNEGMGDKVTNYDTKKERFLTRLVSGFTAAFFLGSDFYNKPISKGKSEEEAKKAQKRKQGQEVKENIVEGLVTFGISSCFAKLTNSSVWASAVIGALVGLGARVISRLTSGMPLTRVKADNKKREISLQNFVNSAKENKKPELTEKEEKHKKPLLSVKNILLTCAGIITAGLSLRYLKGHSSIGSWFNSKIAQHTKKMNAKTVEDVFASRTDIERIKNILLECDEKKYGDKIINDMTDKFDDFGKLFVGTQYKKTNLFGKIQVNTKDLYDLRTAPFRFIKEVVTYPYKIALKLIDAVAKSGIKKEESTISYKIAKHLDSAFDLLKEPDKVILDPHKIKNLFLRFKEFEAKCGGDEERLTREFGEYIKKVRLTSNNMQTKSKIDNSKIAIIAQTLGTLMGMGFNMNDEFNQSIKDGSTKYEAEKDARLRGINKFFRMTVQLIISGSLNSIFARQYNNSLLKAGGVVAASTILTDWGSRLLSGMPSRKMTKEELEQYQKDHKEGFMSWYYKFIDKLAS